eukprot:CAMPEP_0175104846 /NCGR_PEP_ID=MMETSP0086_2-20121207/10023_1 /TAXON_ID=136419 /ORGANISM="Unknown Unknown, Strain D1" /LENGTH=123 /DNA_ID=CAMNT_0016380421 /DNA_START=224 /DNA_END=595 /DNA_ORIENTATION=+
MRIGYLLKRLHSCHTRNQLFEKKEVKAVLVFQRVEHVLHKSSELNLRVLSKEVAREGAQRLEPGGFVSAVVLQLLFLRVRQLGQKHEGTAVERVRSEVLEAIYHHRAHVLEDLNLLEDEVERN